MNYVDQVQTYKAMARTSHAAMLDAEREASIAKELLGEAWDFLVSEWGGTKSWDDPGTSIGSLRARIEKATA